MDTTVTTIARKRFTELGMRIAAWNIRSIKRMFASWAQSAILVAIIVFGITPWLNNYYWSSKDNGDQPLPQAPVPSVPSYPVFPDYKGLSDVIGKSLECRDNPGMQVAIVKNGKTVFSEAYGETIPGSGVKITRDTRFIISSLTKGFTAALMLNVFANNPRNISYNLTTPLRDILGKDFRFFDDVRTKYASAEDLLSHTLGVSNNKWPRMNPNLTRSDYLKFAQHWRTHETFRTRAEYNSPTFILAAAITEYLGGKSWEELAIERLFKPLGFTSTGFVSTTDFNDRDIAMPYCTLEGRHGIIDPYFTKVYNDPCGSGCIISTPDDMTKWMNAILSGGKNETGHQVLPEEQMESLITVRTYLYSSRRDVISKPTFPVTSVANSYALGWRRGVYRGDRVISHSGSSPGYSSMILMLPDEELGIYIAMNGFDSRYVYRLALSHYISDFMMGYEPWLNASTLCTFPEPWTPIVPRENTFYYTDLKPTLVLDSYIGTYRHPVYGNLVISLNQSSNTLLGVFGIGSWVLYPQTVDNQFFAEGSNITHFRHMSRFQFLTSEDDPTNITSVIATGFQPEDPPKFDRV